MLFHFGSSSKNGRDDSLEAADTGGGGHILAFNDFPTSMARGACRVFLDFSLSDEDAVSRQSAAGVYIFIRHFRQ